MCEVWRMTRRRRRPADTPSMRRLACSSFGSARLRLWLAEKKLEVLGSDVEAWCALGLDRTCKKPRRFGSKGEGKHWLPSWIRHRLIDAWLLEVD